MTPGVACGVRTVSTRPRSNDLFFRNRLRIRDEHFGSFDMFA